MSTVRCPNCRTLLGLPPRSRPVRMTCSVCLSPVALPGEAPEVIEIREEVTSAQSEVGESVSLTRVFSVVGILLIGIGVPSADLFVSGKSGSELALAIGFFGLIMISIPALMKKPRRREEFEAEQPAGIMDTLLSVLGILALGLIQAVVGLIVSGILLILLLYVTCVGMQAVLR